jgi:hypothetical protein
MPYLRLWHGRRSLDTDLIGWGEGGPTFGPFPLFHMTFVSEIRFGDCLCLEVVNGLVYYDGLHYGDWAFAAEPESNDLTVDVFDPAKAIVPEQCVETSETPLNGGAF